MSEPLDDYKSKVDPAVRATLRRERDLCFTATTPRGYDLEFDANVEWGCMPVEALLMSLGGCLAIDVISILRKMRCEPETFSMELEGVRSPTPPQRLQRIRLVLHLAGPDLAEEKVRRAVDLSRERYCSLYHSLREDLELEVDLRL